MAKWAMPDVDKAKRPRGRPRRFTPSLGAEICRRLAECGSLREVCKADDMPPEPTVRGWSLDASLTDFVAQYALARQAGYARMAEELLEIADDGTNDWMEREDGSPALNSEHVQRSRLRVDTRKWLLSKVLPKIYGDKLQIGGDGGEPIKVEVGEAIAKLTEAVESVATRMKDGTE